MANEVNSEYEVVKNELTELKEQLEDHKIGFISTMEDDMPVHTVIDKYYEEFLARCRALDEIIDRMLKEIKTETI